MRIAVCSPRLTIGGVGTSTHILTTGLREAGHAADILTTSKVAGADYARARRDGWPVEAIGDGRIWLRDRLVALLDRLSHYDVVINNHSEETGLLLPMLPPRIVRVSVVRTTDRPVIRQSARQAPHLEALVGISPAVARLLEAHDPPCAVHTIPNAVLIEHDRLPELSQPLRLVYVGRLEDRHKRVLLLPAIVAALRRRMSDFKLVIAGDGPDRERLARRIRRLGVASHIDLCGAVPRDAARRLLRDSHFSLVPSRSEGFGLVLAESMAAGAVPLASDIEVFRWILDTDADALLVRGADAEAYAERLTLLVSAPPRYRSLQRRLRARQQACFHPRATVEAYRQLIEALVAAHDPEARAPARLDVRRLPPCARLRCTRCWLRLQGAKQRCLMMTGRR